MKTNKTCIYCDKDNKSEHFICGACGTGMCENCYKNMREHDDHMWEFDESLDDKELVKHIQKETGCDNGYMCYECIDKFSQQLKDNK